jgi:hypothetical protein
VLLPKPVQVATPAVPSKLRQSFVPASSSSSSSSSSRELPAACQLDVRQPDIIVVSSSPEPPAAMYASPMCSSLTLSS